MPQMAPMNWSFLFLIFISLYVISMIVIYFSQNTKSSANYSNISSQNKSMFLWKW